MNSELGIVVISEGGSIEKIRKSIDSIKKILNAECYVAIKRFSFYEIEQFCIENNIGYYEFETRQELYMNALEEMDCSHWAFIYEGDTYTFKNKTEISEYLYENKYEQLFVAPVVYESGQYVLNRSLKNVKLVNIEKTPNRIWLALKSCFIKKELLKKAVMDIYGTNTEYRFDELLAVKVIILNGGYKVIKSIMLKSSEMLEDSPIAKFEHYDEDWYFECCKQGHDILFYSEKHFGMKLKFIQYTAVYLLKNCMNANVNAKNKHILNNEKLELFYSHIKNVLREIDDKIIIDTIGNKRVNYFLLQLKHNSINESIEYREYESNLYVVNKNDFLFDAADTKIKVFLMNYENGCLNITASYPFPFDETKLSIHAEYDNEIFRAEKNHLYSQYKVFGKPLYQNYVFDLKIPLRIKNGRNYIEFYLNGEKSHVKLDLNFNKPLSKLSGAKFAYWNCGEFSINYRKQGLLVMNNKATRTVKREILFIVSLLRSRNEYARKSGRIRLLYQITKPLFQKPIWIFEDKIYKGGDNGEYLYTYAKQQKDGIKKYYVLKEKCLDAERFHKEKKQYIRFGTLRHKLLFLNSNIVFETHNNVTKQHSFDDKSEKYFRDLFNSSNICIQHGLTVQSIPDLANQVNDDLKLYCLASTVERENLLRKEYDYYKNENVLEITGCPRYDGLKNNDKRQILITPTWRSYLALPSFQYGESRRYNCNFKEFSYFKIFNNLVNNKKLIECAEKNSYKVKYLLHPCTSSQIDDYDKNDCVELIAATDDLNYEKILTESSLMVTDYSGVQFDFAYMYKPIIYFHPDELPPSYEEGEYKYETMALGEIVKTSEMLVERLCEYMENGCKIKPEYKQRIDDFFKYHDHNNCERIYQKVMKSGLVEDSYANTKPNKLD